MGDCFPQPQLRRVTKDSRAFIEGLHRGMVYWVDVPSRHAVGVEQYHEDGPTPFVIVSRNNLHRSMPFVQGIPLSRLKESDSQLRAYRVRIPSTEFTYYEVNTEEKPLQQVDVIALTHQARILAHERLLWGPAARVSADALTCIEAGIRHVFDIPP